MNSYVGSIYVSTANCKWNKDTNFIVHISNKTNNEYVPHEFWRIVRQNNLQQSFTDS